MKYRIVFRLLGILLLLQGVAMGVCGGFGLLFEPNPDGALFIGSGFSVVVGLAFSFVIGKKTNDLPKREGLILVGLTWVMFGLFGSIPYMLGGPQLGFADAIFESVSGFTTTGATIIEDLSIWPNDILLWRALSQWLGGLGILVLFMLFLSSLGAGSKFLFKNESGFQPNDFAAVKIRDVALMVLKIYLIMTVVCAVGLKALGMTWFESITHTFTTVSTAGFSIYNESIGFFREWETAWMIEIWLTFFMLSAAISFIFYLMIWRRKFERMREIEEVPFYLGILAFGVVFILVAEYSYVHEDGTLAWIRRSIFTVVSISTTTGYAVVPERDWPAFDIPLLSILMVAGGCIGSTAGGMKVQRILMLARALRQNVVKGFRPHEYSRLKVNGKIVKDGALYQTVLFVAVFFAFVFLATLVVAVLEIQQGIDLETAYGAALTTLSNVGPGFGEVGIWGNFSHLTPITKLFLSFLMVLGRLEIFAFLALFSPTTWKRF